MTTTTTTTTTARGGPVDRWDRIFAIPAGASVGGSGKTCTVNQREEVHVIGPCTELKRVQRPCAPGRPHVQEVRYDVYM
jgi:hypothetical protein